MSTELAAAHIRGQEQLRLATTSAIARIWDSLPGYDEEDVDTFLATAVPIVVAARRQSVSFTDAFLARAIDRARPLGVGAEMLDERDRARRGVDLEQVYRRPFVTVWSALSEQTPWEDAVAKGRARATSAAAMDVQLAMRETLVEVAREDERILGFQRVPDGDACEFCRLVAGQRYKTDQLMPIHNHCGCGVDVITADNRGDFTGKAANDLSLPGVAVHDHGELGPVLGDPAHDFTEL